MTDHDVAPTLRLQPESRRPGATWANRHIFGDMDAITALRAMSSARNINIHVNNDWAYADWGSSPSARRYWARRGVDLDLVARTRPGRIDAFSAIWKPSRHYMPCRSPGTSTYV